MQTVLSGGVPRILCHVPTLARVPLVRNPCCRRMPSIGGYHPYGLASILTGLESNTSMCRIYLADELQPVNTLLPVYRNFGGHYLMSGVIFPKIRLII
ncbi:uncharacterized protein TNCV_3244921 [Trichonephila clavipes]|nr:uncharacterized protein TNCV_3244921 [Trichonephila clavipes]